MILGGVIVWNNGCSMGVYLWSVPREIWEGLRRAKNDQAIGDRSVGLSADDEWESRESETPQSSLVLYIKYLFLVLYIIKKPHISQSYKRNGNGDTRISHQVAPS